VITIYVPRDSAALAVDANEVADAIERLADQRKERVTIVRNGTRGLLWLEPLVEVETQHGRVGYGPVALDDVAALFDAGFVRGAEHPLAIGLVDALPYLKSQERLTFARAGVTDPLSIADYREHGGYAGLEGALRRSQAEIVEQVTQSGLRGRGGAAFPTGIKWKTVLEAAGAPKYIVCNADEGDSGSYADRIVMESDPLLLIEGMTIAGLAVDSQQGYIYVRSEYPDAIATLERAIDVAVRAGYLGANIRGSGRAFAIEVRKGAGSYVCGEETALLDSLEGKRGIVRAKPPLPAHKGLFGKPTVINNVLSFAAIPTIMARGAKFYADFGMGRSRGTLPFTLAGNLKQPGLVEKAFGVTLRELLYDYGGGSASGRPLKAVQIGGPLGAYLPQSQFDTPMDYEALVAVEGMLGHGGLVAFDDTVDMLRMAQFAMQFCAFESCGKCTPCRIGSQRGVEVIGRIRTAKNGDRPAQVALLKDLCTTMLDGSLCAMGGMTPYPVLSALRHFPEEFGLAAAASPDGPRSTHA
jgi:formate dehydrogenase iron-sulfur subunit